MNDENRPGEANDGLVPDAEEIMAGEVDEAPLEPETNEEALARQLIDARREQEEQRQAMLRAMAEAENVRRRAQRDVADAKAYAVTSFARDLLNVADNFKRAMGAMPAEVPEDLKGLVEGVQMTERELLSVFERHGVKIIEPVGERFDPNRHQAMFEMENPDLPNGTVVQVVQAGAVIGERTLRPAMVGLSKGGPKPSEAKPADAAADTAADGAGPDDEGSAV